MTTDPLLTTGQVAVKFQVTPSAVVRWANAGTIPHIRTPSGRRRFRLSDVNRMLNDSAA